MNKSKTTRKIINVSVPENLYKEVNRLVKEGGFASKSEYVRHLLRRQEEDAVVAEIQRRRRDVRRGNVKKLRSLDDLR